MNDFQQAFLRWLDLNRRNVAVHPLFEQLEPTGLRYRFEHLIPGVALYVSTNEVRVDAFKGVPKRHEAWDTLFRSRICKLEPCRLDDYVDGGLTCTEHPGRYYMPGESEESILNEHCFDALRTWISDELQPACWLVLGESEFGTSAFLQLEAETEPPSEEDGSHYERIRLHRRSRFRRKNV